MTWLLVLPGYQQPWYWIHMTNGCLASTRKDFNYLYLYMYHLSVNSLASGRSEGDSKKVIYNLVLLTGTFRYFHDNDECHRTLLMISQHWFREWLGAVRQQAITWASVDSVLCHFMASLGHNELKIREKKMYLNLAPQKKLNMTRIHMLHKKYTIFRLIFNTDLILSSSNIFETRLDLRRKLCVQISAYAGEPEFSSTVEICKFKSSLSSRKSPAASGFCA